MSNEAIGVAGHVVFREPWTDQIAREEFCF